MLSYQNLWFRLWLPQLQEGLRGDGELAAGAPQMDGLGVRDRGNDQEVPLTGYWHVYCSTGTPPSLTSGHSEFCSGRSSTSLVSDLTRTCQTPPCWPPSTPRPPPPCPPPGTATGTCTTSCWSAGTSTRTSGPVLEKFTFFSRERIWDIHPPSASPV